MGTRQEIISSFYEESHEEDRLTRSRHGQLEYATTMEYIHRFATKGAKVIELGAGTGRYSLVLAKEGMDVTAVELTKSNFEILAKNCEGVPGIEAV